MEQVRAALVFFPLKEKVEQVQPFGQGHINETFRVTTAKQEWLLQAVNTSVFQHPEIIEAHLQLLLKHNTKLFVPHVLSKERTYHITAGGKVWRLQQFMQNTYAPDGCNDDQRKEVVKGIAAFTQSVHGLSLSDFRPTIPKFHDLSDRLLQYEKAKAADPLHRLKSAKAIVEKLDQWKGIANRFEGLVRKGLPLRIVHNDAKSTNVLLHQNDNRLAKVIDLDTAGPGYLLFDFGDLLRSMLPDVRENASVNKVNISRERAKQMQAVFLDECGNLLSPLEQETLGFGGLYMTYLMALRFFTDYLMGDIYYRVNHPNENLDRATNQCAVLEGMLEVSIG